MRRLLPPLVLSLLASPLFALPKQYLALFTFQNASYGQLSDDQLRILQASPFDGMAMWLSGGYDVAPPPDLEQVSPRLPKAP
jgi:hypothetical protein